MMGLRRGSTTILIADDDAADRMLVEDAFRESRVVCERRYVEDGQELLDYLRHQGKYALAENAPRPALILLDLHMPRIDGHEALRQIKSDPKLSFIPVIVFTGSKAPEDIERAYDLGSASYIAKPATFEELVRITTVIGKYWFDVVAIPDV